MQHQGTHYLFCACCSCSCNFLCQWDMARAVPRKVNEVKLFTGDIQGLCTGRDKVFACTSKGAIRYCSSPFQFLFSSVSYIHNGLVVDCLLTTLDMYASRLLFCLHLNCLELLWVCLHLKQIVSHLPQNAFLNPEMSTVSHHSPCYREIQTSEMSGDRGNAFLHWPDVSGHFIPSSNQGPLCSTLAASLPCSIWLQGLEHWQERCAIRGRRPVESLLCIKATIRVLFAQPLHPHQLYMWL